MAEIKMRLNDPVSKDDSPCWIKNVKHNTVICIPQYQWLEKRRELDEKGEHIYELTEPEFVPAKKINPFDDEKKQSAQKRANTEKTMNEIQEITQGTSKEIEDFAKTHDVSLAGAKNKKEKLEILEKAGVLY